MDKEQSISVLWRLLLGMNRQLKITLLAMSCKSGISYSAMGVIFRLENQSTMKMNDIADYLSITLGAATSLVDKLEELCWVERVRCQEDRRIIFVRSRTFLGGSRRSSGSPPSAASVIQRCRNDKQRAVRLHFPGRRMLCSAAAYI